MRWYNASAYYAMAVSQALAQRGHKVIVAGDFPSPPLEKAEKLSLGVNPQLNLSRWDHNSILANLKRLSDIIKQEKIDVIDAHRGEGHFYASLLKKLLKSNIKVIRTRADIRPPQRNIFNQILNHKLTDGVITSCKVLEESYQKNLNFDSDNLRNIPVGIDTKYFTADHKSDLRQHLNLNKETPVVGIVGRLSPVKGHIYFIEAAKFMLEQFPEAKFLIAGQDAQISKSFLKEKVKSLGMERNFHFLGRVPDIRDVIASLDIGVVASIGSESVCRVALEYMAMGKPVVATRINAIPEVVIHGENGFLVPPQNGREMGEAILRLLQDEKKRKQMGEKSRLLAEEKFSLEKFGEETEKFYLQILNAKNS